MSQSRLNDKKLIIFGAGQLGQQFCSEIGFPADCFVDNDEKKWGTYILGKPVLSPSILKEDQENVFIIVASRYYHEIATQLSKLGYKKGLHFIGVDETKEWAAFTVRELLKRYINQDPHTLAKYDLKTLYNKVQNEYIPIEAANFVESMTISWRPLEISQKLKLSKDNYPQGFTLLIHGSQADGTYTAFSDIDDIVILNKEFFQSFDVFKKTIVELHRLNKCYQIYDITQHHGHWIFTYDELFNLNEAVMPACVFKESVSVFGDINLQYFVREKSNFGQAILHLCDQIENGLNNIFSNNINLFTLKHFVSGIALLIPLYYQFIGKMMTKKEAITEAIETLDEDIVDIIKWTSDIRKNWDRVPTYREVETFKSICNKFSNRVEIERYVLNHAPAISAAALGVDSDNFRGKVLEMLSFFKTSVTRG